MDHVANFCFLPTDWVDFLIFVILISSSFLLRLSLELEIRLALNGGRREKEECPSLHILDL